MQSIPAWMFRPSLLFCCMTYDHLHILLTEAGSATQRQTVSIPGFHHAAVLVPVIHCAEEPELLLTRRTEEVESHKGQVAFPGGMVEEGDRDIVHTALREANEELGIDSGVIEVLGLLDDHATPTGFIITPVLGLIRGIPTLQVNAEEVAETFLLPLRFFTSHANVRCEQREFLGVVHDVWFYDGAPHVIWGATAAIVRGLLRRMRWI
jgi:8-oxo-dGTP pyrophosphatase MutT (NUDIX family)